MHSHGLMRFGDGLLPDSYELSELAIKGHKISVIKNYDEIIF